MTLKAIKVNDNRGNGTNGGADSGAGDGGSRYDKSKNWLGSKTSNI